MHLATQIKNVPGFLSTTPHSKYEDADYLEIMCHEIRTPLNAIIGLATILASLQCRPEKQKECADMLYDSSRMLAELLNNLLDSSKLDNHKIELEHIIFDLSKVLEEAKNIVAIKAQEKGLCMHVRIGNGVPALFVGDPHRIRQILINLLGNAIKFTDHGTISLHMTEEPGQNGYSQVQITVADSGIGIEKEQLEKIFGKYEQAHSNINRKYGGTGLGLFISQGLAQRMNGNITVKSWPGKGSHFIVTLPLMKASMLIAAA